MFNQFGYSSKDFSKRTGFGSKDLVDDDLPTNRKKKSKRNLRESKDVTISALDRIFTDSDFEEMGLDAYLSNDNPIQSTKVTLEKLMSSEGKPARIKKFTKTPRHRRIIDISSSSSSDLEVPAKKKKKTSTSKKPIDSDDVLKIPITTAGRIVLRTNNATSESRALFANNSLTKEVCFLEDAIGSGKFYTYQICVPRLF